jgi:hypothetical protein
MLKYSLLLSGFLLLLGGCIGVDYLDDPIVGERIGTESQPVAILKGNTYQSKAKYYDQYGVEQMVDLVWSSSNSLIASVNEDGLVTGNASGQATIIVSFNTAESSFQVNVVLDQNQVASVEISIPGNQTSLAIGGTVSLSVAVKNIEAQALADRTIEWFSENASIASVDNMGVVTGLGMGMVDIHAKSEGVKSNVITLSVGGGRSGSFVGAGGYTAAGTATLSVMDNKLILQLSNNFQTSFALGTFVYLANSTNGAQVRASGLEVAQITTNGAKTFDITAISPTTGLLDYRYVIILCKPATVTFGYADLN